MIAIVGSGVAGLSAAEALRDLGYGGQLRVFGAEAEIPYERPTLSKSFLIDQELAEPPALRSAAVLAEHGITLELGTEVVAIQTKRQILVTARGEAVRYEQLLLATGAQPRRLELPQAYLKGIHYLRELADARGLRSALRPGTSVAIIGGGVIGLEVAASAIQLGATVTVIEVGPQLMGRVAPEGFANLLEELHRARGVAVRTAARPIGFEGSSGRVRGLALAEGDIVPADTVVVGVGAVPRTALAARAGLAVDDGIVVNKHFHSSDERIFAAGDAARVFHADQGRHVRVEQWLPAQKQGRQAAACMLGAAEPYRDVPWMWSDQHDLHLQATGFGFAEVELVRRGDLDTRPGIAYLGIRGGRLVAACGVSIGTGVGKTIRAAQILIERGTRIDTDHLADPGLDLRRLANTAMPL